MAASRYNFDIQVQFDGRWITETIRDREDEARALAAQLFANRTCEGARIVRNWTRPDGKIVETEVFCQTRAVKDDGPIRIVQIESAPAKCEALKDYFSYDSRQTMIRLFRDYFNKILVTPTEVIHDFKELQRIQDKDSLVRSAIDQVAYLQTRESEQETKSRRDELYKSFDQMSDRARQVDRAGLPRLDGKFSEMMGAIGGVLDQEERDYLALVALSRDLLNLRNWLGKLELLCSLTAIEDDPHAIQLLDGVIADVLGSDVIQEILGWQSTLADAICQMFDLADGTMATGKSHAGESAINLNQLLASGKLPASRRCIVDRAHRQLRAANPLHPRDILQEFDEFRKVLARLLLPTGLHSGPETAEALTTRFSRMVEQGGSTGRRAAICGVFGAMPDRATGAIYLCDLARSGYAKDHLADMIELFDLVYVTDSIGELCQPMLSPKELMTRATTAFHAVIDSPFPADVKRKIADHIDGVLERYLVEERIVEKLDHPDSHLRDRARLLVQFCGSGLLPEGRALARARERTLALLRQPDFTTRFVSGIADPALAQKALREFYGLLNSKGGFR